jgi:hypothetical protein
MGRIAMPECCKLVLMKWFHKYQEFPQTHQLLLNIVIPTIVHHLFRHVLHLRLVFHLEKLKIIQLVGKMEMVMQFRSASHHLLQQFPIHSQI